MTSETTIKEMTSGVIGALKYVRKHAGSQIVVKIGGSALRDAGLLQSLCEDLAVIREVGIKLVVVHGGGPAINRELERRQIKWDFVEGIRVTTPEIMEVVETILCGEVNRGLVRAMNAAGLSAVGMSGADSSTLLCKAADPRLGLVGEVEQVNTKLIEGIIGLKDELDRPSIPVIAPVGIGEDGSAYNINADWAASTIATELGVKKMIFLTDQDGILNAGKELLPELDAGDLEQLIDDGVVLGGMLAKVRTILHALQNKVSEVHVLNGRRPSVLIDELFTEKGAGTVCRLRSRAPRKEV